MSEKLDGVRAIWTGSELISRNNKPINAPEWFLKSLPDISLDGELHVGRGKFQETVSIVRKKKPVDAEWKSVLYSVFDAPGQFDDFSYRCSVIKAHEESDIWHGLDHFQVEGDAHVQEFYQQLLALGAEGVMFKCPTRPYVQGRSDALLKYKPVFSEEAIVIGYQPGKGKHLGRVGALVCTAKNGAQFEIGTGLSDVQRENPPALGSVVTYEFGGITDGGVPRFPRFVAVRDYE
jgi:DNA ligase-1